MSISADKLRGMFEEGLGKRLLSIKNVVGYSTTPKKKIKNGIETDIDCIRVYVKRKFPKLELKAEDIIPESVGGIPTDVVEIGELRALAYTQRMRPCPPGYSIGEKSITAGTFGCVVKDNQSGENWILSNNHVLAAENKAPIGSEILQPGAYDSGTVANDTIAKLARFVTVNIAGPSGCTLSRAVAEILNGLSIAFGRKTRFRAVVEQLSNDVDCAAARPINQADILLEVKDIGKPSGSAEAQVGDECHKTGRCFAKDTLILTNPEGPKTVDDLKVGDKVVCYNEAEGKVEAHPIVDIISQGVRDVYRIKTRNKMVEVTDNHPFLVAVNKGQFKKPVSVHLGSGDIVQYKSFNDWALRWKELGELRRGDTIVALHHFDGNEGGEIGEECARLLGFIVGDGSVGRDVRLYCTSSEEAEKYRQLLMKLFPEPTVERRCTRCYHSYISHANAKDPICNDCGSHYSTVTRRFLREGGTTKRGKVYVVIYSSKAAATQLGKYIHGKKLKRRIPKAIWSLPIASKRAFIEGYCDADGHRATHYSSGHTRKYCFQSPNERLIKEIRELCVSCGIRVTNILSRMKNGYQSKVNWEFTAYPDSDSRKMSKLARPKGLRISKSGLYRSIRLPEELQFESVMGIQNIGPKETYDIEVEGSHNFIGNGILLHNTTMHTHLKVTDVDFTGNVQYSSGVALFVDQIVAQGIGGVGSSGGDSGSAVFLASGNGTTLTGLLFAGSDTQNITIINKIKNVFKELGVSLAT